VEKKRLIAKQRDDKFAEFYRELDQTPLDEIFEIIETN